VVQVEVINDGVVVKHAEARINVLRNAITRTPDAYISVPGATVSVYYGCGHTRIERPFIYLKGIDPFETRHAADIYSGVIDPSNLVMLRDFNYDFIIVDWASSTASIETNANVVISLLQTLISTADTTGADSFSQFVVLGESMGGVIGRYALATMEAPAYVSLHPHSHNTRLFINLDGPQQGAFVPVGAQAYYDYLDQTILIPIARAIGSLGLQKYLSAFEERTLARPAVRELLIYNNVDRNIFNSTYPEDPMRKTLMNELATLGYPQHCKTVTLTNGLIDSPSRQVTFSNVITAPSSPYINMQLNYKINFLDLFNIPYFNITAFKIFTDPPLNTPGLILQDSFTKLSINFQGCLDRIFSLGFWHATCVSWPLTVINVYADSVQPLDIMPGGQYPTVSNIYDYTSFSAFNIESLFWYNSTTGPTYIKLTSSGILNPANISFTLYNYIDHFCFVPRFSSLDYSAPHANFPADHDIMTDPIDTIVGRIPFDVMAGWYNNHGSNPDRVPYPTFNDPYGDNSYHLTVRSDTISYADAVHPITWLAREVGDDVMNLDNLWINRKAQFHVRDSIVAGYSESPYYYYPSGISPSPYTGIYSKQSDFLVDSIGGDVTLKAGHRIIMQNGFIAKQGSRFYAVLDSDVICTLPYGSLSFPPPQGNPNDTAKSQSATLQNLSANKTASLKVYPNPSHNQFFVEIKGDSLGPANVTLMNTIGNIITIFTVTNESSFVIDAAKYNLKKGMYILVVQTDEIVFKKKLIVN